MKKKHKLLWTLVILLALGITAAWVLSYQTHLGWIRAAGVALSLVVLGIIWFWPGIEQPKGPPLWRRAAHGMDIRFQANPRRHFNKQRRSET